MFSNLIKSSLLDELLLYVSPKILGHTAKSITSINSITGAVTLSAPYTWFDDDLLLFEKVTNMKEEHITTQDCRLTNA